MGKQKITYRFHNLVSDKAVQKRYIENQLIKNTVERIFQQMLETEKYESTEYGRVARKGEIGLL